MSVNPLIPRRDMAKRISEEVFHVSTRNLAKWSELSYRRMGREALYNEEDGLIAARARLDNAPLISGGE